MALYERNSIQLIDNEEAVYVSYPCEDDNEYDHILVSNLSKVAINIHNIKMYNIINCNIDNTDISFECKYDKVIDPVNVYLYACKDDFKSTPVKIELQDYVDSLAESIYKNDDFENIDKIKEAKQNAISNFMNDIFNLTGQISAQYIYDTVGRIIDKNGDIISIINNFETNIDDGITVFSLNDCVSYIALKDIDTPKIEFITNHVKITIDKFTILSSSEGMFRQYKIIVNSAKIENTTEKQIAETNTEIINEDLFFDERVRLLSDRNKVFSNNTKSNDIEDMFSDFDF